MNGTRLSSRIIAAELALERLSYGGPERRDPASMTDAEAALAVWKLCRHPVEPPEPSFSPAEEAELVAAWKQLRSRGMPG